jgi:hypothetical protein
MTPTVGLCNRHGDLDVVAVDHDGAGVPGRGQVGLGGLAGLGRVELPEHGVTGAGT